MYQFFSNIFNNIQFVDLKYKISEGLEIKLKKLNNYPIHSLLEKIAKRRERTWVF